MLQSGGEMKGSLSRGEKMGFRVEEWYDLRGRKKRMNGSLVCKQQDERCEQESNC